MPLNAIDLTRIPSPDALVVVDHAAKVAQMKAQLVAARPDLAPVLTLASEPLVKLIEAWAYEAVLKSAEINAGVRAMLLTEADGADLDNIAANHLIQRLDGESDDDFRQRVALGPEGWASAGPRGAYLFHARSASPLVADVDVFKAAPGVVRIVVLSSAEDGVADAALLATVAEALNDEEVRPLGSDLEIVSATVAGFDVAAALKVLPGPDAGPVATTAEAAVRAYAADRRKLGRGVTLDGIKAALMQPGVEAVALAEPAADIAAAAEVAPVLGDVTLTVEVMA